MEILGELCGLQLQAEVALVYIWHSGEEGTVGGSEGGRGGEHSFEGDAHPDFADPVNFWGRGLEDLRKDAQSLE